ncbi:hypothetical protein RHECNPAF_890089 [Rhizobium etli CNPAF512]|nr:hypothetical protein RHECNPAF_890089 [Rhizobium etli CNPAF512]
MIRSRRCGAWARCRGPASRSMKTESIPALRLRS